MPLDKHRIRFSKSGALRLVSHLDLMRCLERLLRRARLPFRMTEGFHPAPRIVLAQSLPLGIVGLAEVVEVELTEELEPDEVLVGLRAEAPPGLDFISARRIPLKMTARPWRACYRIPDVDFSADMASRLPEILDSSELWVPRERPKPREVNIRPYIDSLTFTERTLSMSLWVTQEGSARADEIARLVGVIDPPMIERTTLELLDEIAPEMAASTPKIEPQTRPWNRNTPPVPTLVVPRETWGATANGPIVE